MKILFNYEDDFVDNKHLKFFTAYKTTTNRHIYNVSQKASREQNGIIKCSICKYHKGENSGSKTYFKNWKAYRKTQYRNISIKTVDICK